MHVGLALFRALKITITSLKDWRAERAHGGCISAAMEGSSPRTTRTTEVQLVT